MLKLPTKKLMALPATRRLALEALKRMWDENPPKVTLNALGEFEEDDTERKAIRMRMRMVKNL